MKIKRVCSFDRCVFDHGVREEGRPEVGNSGSVVDFEHVELLGDLSVKLELLSLESRDDLLAQVDGDEIFKLGNLNDLTFEGFHGVCKTSSITGVLEECSHGSLTSVETV